MCLGGGVGIFCWLISFLFVLSSFEGLCPSTCGEEAQRSGRALLMRYMVFEGNKLETPPPSLRALRSLCSLPLKH